MCGGWIGDIIDDTKENIDDVKDTVVDWGNEVIDTGSDVSDWIVDEVLDPIVETTEDIYKTIEDDPLYNIAKITAIATGNSWALPLIDGAKVANNGGDWEDIARAAAKSYVASKVGASAGQYAGDAAGQYITNEAAAAAAQEVVSQAVGQAATTAVITGGDLEAIKDSFVTGAITGGVGAGLDYIEANVQTYENLPQSAKNVVSTYIGAVANNEDATPEMLTNAAVSGLITADIVQKYFDSDKSMTDRQLAAVTSGLNNTIAAAINGKPLSQAAINAVSQYGAASMEEWLDTTGKDLIDRGYDRITGSYGDVNESIDLIEGETDTYNGLIDDYNAKVAELTPRYDERDRLYQEYEDALAANQAQPSEATKNAALAARDRYQAYADRLQSDYDKSYKSYLDSTMDKIEASRTKLDGYTATYETQIEDLKSETYQAQLALDPVNEGLNKIVVEGLTGGAGNFNPEEYKQINGLGEDDNAYQHYLEQGRANDAPVNAQEHVAEIQKSKDQLIQQTMGEAGVSVSELTDNQQRAISDYFGAMSLDELRNADVAAAKTEVQDIILQQSSVFPEGVSQEQRDQFFADIEAELGGRDAAVQSIVKQQPNKSIATARAEGITDADIISGRATFQQGDDGLWRWDDIRISVPIPTYNEELGIYTLVQENIENGVLTYKETNPLNNQVVAEFQGTYTQTIDGKDYYAQVTATEGDGQNKPVITYAQAARPTLDRLAQEDRAAFVANIGSMGAEAYQELADKFGAPVVDFATNLTNRILEQEEVQNVLESETFRNLSDLTGVSVEAGGELLNSFNTLALLVGIDPKSTPLAEVANDLMALGGDMKSEEWKQAQRNISERIANANKDIDPDASAWERAFNTVTAIGGAALTNPGVFAGEYIFKEIVQEVPIFLASGGVGNVTRRMFQEAGEQFAADLGKKAALSSALVLDTAESFGGTAMGAYDEALQVALNSGMNEADAQAYAVDKAITAGGISALTSLATGGVGAGRINEAVFNGRKGATFDKAYAAVGAETLSEGLEEALPQAYLETQFVQLDPSRDSVGNVTANAMLGMIGGFGVSSTIYGTTFSNDAVTNAVQIFNPQVRNVVYNAPNTQEGATQAQQQLADLGLTDNVLQTNLLNNVFDAGYTTTDEAYNAYQATNTGYAPTQEDVNRFVGAGDTTQQINEYVADRTTTDADEARQYFTDLGYTATEDQINQFVGNTFEDTARTNIGEYVAPRQTTADYVREQLSQYGYNPTDEEVNRFVGYGTEDTFKQDKTQEITEYLDPFVNTEQEVRQIYSDLGLDNVLQEDVDRFTGTVNVGQDLTSDIQNYQNTAATNLLTQQVNNLTTQLETAQQQQQDTQQQQQQQQNTQTQNLVTNLVQNLVQREEDAAGGALKQNLMGRGLLGGGMGEVVTPDPAQIDYLYDFSSIFANPSQESMFLSPYAEGGQVSSTDRLLGIINNE